jgi:hypothetical protein
VVVAGGRVGPRTGGTGLGAARRGGDEESRESDDLLITWLAGVLAGAMGEQGNRKET